MMNRSLRLLGALTAALVLAWTTAPLFAQRGIGVGLSRAPGLDHPLQVDCTQAASLQAALDSVPQNTDQIIIEIRGFCAEPILIKRKVIIRGTDPQTDGIAGPSTGNSSALVAVHGVDEFWQTSTVRLEHLTIKDSSNIGLSVNFAQVRLDDVVIRNNGNIGLGAFPGAYVTATNLIVTDNAGSGLFSQGRLSCADCTVSGNGPAGPAGIAADQAGKIILSNTFLTGATGIQATSSGEVTMFGGAITAITRAAVIQNGGRVFFQSDTQVTGTINCGLQGILDSRRGSGTAGFTQLSNASGGANLIQNGCVFLAGAGTTTFAGPTQVGAGSVTATDGGNFAIVRYGSLSCFNGGKVTASGGQIFVNNVPGIPAACGT